MGMGLPGPPCAVPLAWCCRNGIMSTGDRPPRRFSEGFPGQPASHLHTLTAASLPHCSLQDAGIGFILVIDRRRDKWTSVKASVLRIAVSASRGSAPRPAPPWAG